MVFSRWVAVGVMHERFKLAEHQLNFCDDANAFCAVYL